MYQQHSEEWHLMALGHLLLIPSKGTLQPAPKAVPSNTCLQQRGTSSFLLKLKSVGTAAQEQPSQRANPQLLLTADTKPHTPAGKTKSWRKPIPYTSGGVGCPQPLKETLSKPLKCKEVLMKNTRWHSHAIEKVHQALPNYKEFRFFSKL